MAGTYPDGDPVGSSNNGGQVIPVTIVCRDDANGPGRSDDTPSCGSTAPPGPCA